MKVELSQRDADDFCVAMGAQPERLLLAAVFARAVRDLVSYSRGYNLEERQIAEAARAWIFDDDAEDSHITSFQNICTVMDMDTERVRQRIRCLLADGTKRLSFEPHGW